MLSIKPKYVALIADGQKTIEVRKTRPKLDTPFKCYIYCTIGNGMKGDYLIPSGIQCGKVIGEFVCDNIIQWNYKKFITLTGTNNTYFPFSDDLKATCLSYDEFAKYGNGKTLYGWHISDLVIYDEPRCLSEFGLLNSPQSWRYI